MSHHAMLPSCRHHPRHLHHLCHPRRSALIGTCCCMDNRTVSTYGTTVIKYSTAAYYIPGKATFASAAKFGRKQSQAASLAVGRSRLRLHWHLRHRIPRRKRTVNTLRCDALNSAFQNGPHLRSRSQQIRLHQRAWFRVVQGRETREQKRHRHLGPRDRNLNLLSPPGSRSSGCFHLQSNIYIM